MGPNRSYALHLCLMAVTLLLLLCDVMISQHCHSIINLVDGFNTLFILMHMALSLPLPTRSRCTGDASAASLHSSPASLPSVPNGSSSSPTPSPPSPSTEPLTKLAPAHILIQPITCGLSIHSARPPLHPSGPNFNQLSLSNIHAVNLHSNPLNSHSSTVLSNPATLPCPFSWSLPSSPPSPSPHALHTPLCGLFYSQVRIQAVGAFLAALVLASLCVSVSMEIFSHILQPRPVRQPHWAVVVGALSLVHNLAVLGLRWGRMLGVSTGLAWEGETTPHPHDVKAMEQTKHDAKQACVVDEASDLCSAVDGTYQGGTLILCNAGASSVLEPDSDSKAQDQNTLPSLQTQKPPPTQELHVDTAVPQGVSSFPCNRANQNVDSNTLTAQSQDHGVPNGVTVAEPCMCDSHSNGRVNEISRSCATKGHSENQNMSKTSLIFKTDQPTENPAPKVHFGGCSSSLITAMQGLFSSILALTNALVLRLVVPQCRQRSWSCGLLVYLDPVFSLLAIIVLLATALPQVYRYGLLLLQASPPKVCVSDLQRRIASVAGVQGVHELHIWQLTEMCTVASVHVHCHCDFQTHRCGDLISGVTNVLKSVGVTCCTVQPEFLPSSTTSNSSLDNISSPPVIHTDQSSLSPSLACSLACGKACAGRMCCSLPKKESCKPLAPPAGECDIEPQMLVIENTFL